MPWIDIFVRKSIDSQGIARFRLIPLGILFLIPAAALALLAVEAFALSVIISGIWPEDSTSHLLRTASPLASVAVGLWFAIIPIWVIIPAIQILRMSRHPRWRLKVESEGPVTRLVVERNPTSKAAMCRAFAPLLGFYFYMMLPLPIIGFSKSLELGFQMTAGLVVTIIIAIPMGIAAFKFSTWLNTRWGQKPSAAKSFSIITFNSDTRLLDADRTNPYIPPPIWSTRDRPVVPADRFVLVQNVGEMAVWPGRSPEESYRLFFVRADEQRGYSLGLQRGVGEPEAAVDAAKALNQAIGHDQGDDIVTRKTFGRVAVYCFYAIFLAAFAVLSWLAFARSDMLSILFASDTSVPQRCLAAARAAAVSAPILAVLASLVAALQVWALRRRWPEAEQPLPFKTPRFFGRAKRFRPTGPTFRK